MSKHDPIIEKLLNMSMEEIEAAGEPYDIFEGLEDYSHALDDVPAEEPSLTLGICEDYHSAVGETYGREPLTFEADYRARSDDAILKHANLRVNRSGFSLSLKI